MAETDVPPNTTSGQPTRCARQNTGTADGTPASEPESWRSGFLHLCDRLDRDRALANFACDMYFEGRDEGTLDAVRFGHSLDELTEHLDHTVALSTALLERMRTASLARLDGPGTNPT
jgi:hypothetical protein